MLHSLVGGAPAPCSPDPSPSAVVLL